MNIIEFLIAFPFICGLLLFAIKKDNIRKVIVIISTIAIISAVIFYTANNILTESSYFYLLETSFIDTIMLICEIAIMCLIVYLAAKYKKYYVIVLSVIQTGLIVWLDLAKEEGIKLSFHLYADKLSIIMCIIIGVVGTLICLYAVGYMKDYHQHHKEYKDRSPFFFGILFLFLSAMFGLIFSNNLIWIYFFWEITTLCSFLLIGYTKTEEAINNSFRALWMNLLGGLAFAIAIVYCGLYLQDLGLQDLIKMGLSGVPILFPVILLSFAALTKSAQFPFSRWLLGAMVAPTPTSALLHSATMVKAGVYLLIRLSPVLSFNLAGIMVTTIGGFTFLSASLLAISQSDGKKVLAYSTIANLGLIAACAGIGVHEAVWAATFLMIFHAVSKSLLFLSVGAVENRIGSRNIEDMHGLIVRQPELALIMVVGIAGMFLAPFGMLISKWAALKSFVDADNLLLIFFLVFGSAATLFYWTKWLGKLVAVLHHSERLSNTTKGTEWVSLIVHTVLMIALCVLFPAISTYLIEPFLVDMFGNNIPAIISAGNINIMIFMLCMIAVLPFAIRYLTFGRKPKTVSSYMSGVNVGNDREFIDSFGNKKEIYLSSWYMTEYFGEKRLLVPSIVLAASFLVGILSIALGGIIL